MWFIYIIIYNLYIKIIKVDLLIVLPVDFDLQHIEFENMLVECLKHHFFFTLFQLILAIVS